MVSPWRVILPEHVYVMENYQLAYVYDIIRLPSRDISVLHYNY